MYEEYDDPYANDDYGAMDLQSLMALLGGGGQSYAPGGAGAPYPQSAPNAQAIAALSGQAPTAPATPTTTLAALQGNAERSQLPEAPNANAFGQQPAMPQIPGMDSMQIGPTPPVASDPMAAQDVGGGAPPGAIPGQPHSGIDLSNPEAIWKQINDISSGAPSPKTGDFFQSLMKQYDAAAEKRGAKKNNSISDFLIGAGKSMSEAGSKPGSTFWGAAGQGLSGGSEHLQGQRKEQLEQEKARDEVRFKLMLEGLKEAGGVRNNDMLAKAKTEEAKARLAQAEVANKLRRDMATNRTNDIKVRKDEEAYTYAIKKAGDAIDPARKGMGLIARNKQILGELAGLGGTGLGQYTADDLGKKITKAGLSTIPTSKRLELLQEFEANADNLAIMSAKANFPQRVTNADLSLERFIKPNGTFTIPTNLNLYDTMEKGFVKPLQKMDFIAAMRSKGDYTMADINRAWAKYEPKGDEDFEAYDFDGLMRAKAVQQRKADQKQGQKTAKSGDKPVVKVAPVSADQHPAYIAKAKQYREAGKDPQAIRNFLEERGIPIPEGF